MKGDTATYQYDTLAGHRVTGEKGIDDAMNVQITDNAMSSDGTRHTALHAGDGWELSWLPGRKLTRNQATTGVMLAEAVATMQDEGRSVVADYNHRLWPSIDQWAGELDLSGPDAVARVSETTGGA